MVARRQSKKAPKAKRRTSGGKRRKGAGKGQNFEREVCRDLSLWVSGGKAIDLFWRAAMSGGSATRHGAAVRQAGDITAVASEGHILTDHCYIECKFYRDLAIQSFFVSGIGTLAHFWRDTLAKAKERKRHPILIAKQNNTPPLVITQRQGPFYYTPDTPMVDIDMLDLMRCAVFRLEDILHLDFKKIAKEL